MNFKKIIFSVELAEMVVEAEIFPSVLTCLKVRALRTADSLVNPILGQR